MTQTNVRAAWAVFFVACVSFVAFGSLGVGRGGTAPGMDLKFLYVAGQTWLHGANAYDFAARSPYLVNATDDVYAFAYPPHIFPLCALVAAFDFRKATLLMELINAASAGLLAYFCARQVASGENPEMDPPSWTAPLVAAIVLGSPFTTHVAYMGQTSLISIAALVWCWHYWRRGAWMASGWLLAVATIKPQICLFVMLWFLLEREWRVLSIAAGFVVLMAVPALLMTGPIGVASSWLAEMHRYSTSPYNLPTFQHAVGLRTVLIHLGISEPLLLALGMAVTLGIWRSRWRPVSEDLLALLISTAFAFGQWHDYDLVALAPLLASVWRHAWRRRPTAVVMLISLCALFVPQRFLRVIGVPLLLQYRSLILAGLAIWLFLTSSRARSRQPLAAVAS